MTGTGTLTEAGAIRIGAPALAGSEVSWTGCSDTCVHNVYHRGYRICGTLSYVGADKGIDFHVSIFD